MSKKIIFALLFAIAGTSLFSQESVKTNSITTGSYAIIEMQIMNYSKPDIITLYYEDGKTEDLTGKLFAVKKISTAAKVSQSSDADDLYYEADTTHSVTRTPLAQKVLLLLKYMDEKNYVLASSLEFTSHYEYIFQKKEN